MTVAPPPPEVTVTSTEAVPHVPPKQAIAHTQLSLHPNSVVYRLERWEALTGWNPRTYSGLSRSVASLEIGD